MAQHGHSAEYLAFQGGLRVSGDEQFVGAFTLKMCSCPGQGFSADMQIYLDANVEMDATYAYYFSGTIVPPAVTGTYAYFSLEPSAYLGLRIIGNARLQTTTGRKKLLDTISYPGLSIKGIAAVGPTMDLYGEVKPIRNIANSFSKVTKLQIRGVITLKGQMNAGAKLNFGKAEVYWSQQWDCGLVGLL